MNAAAFKKIIRIQVDCKKHILSHRKEVDGYNRQIELDQTVNQEFGQTDWEIEIDKIFYFPREMIEITEKHIKQLEEAERRRIAQILKGEDGTSRNHTREDAESEQIPSNNRKAAASTTTFQTN